MTALPPTLDSLIVKHGNNAAAVPAAQAEHEAAVAAHHAEQRRKIAEMNALRAA